MLPIFYYPCIKYKIRDTTFELDLSCVFEMKNIWTNTLQNISNEYPTQTVVIMGDSALARCKFRHCNTTIQFITNTCSVFGEYFLDMVVYIELLNKMHLHFQVLQP